MWGPQRAAVTKPQPTSSLLTRGTAYGSSSLKIPGSSVTSGAGNGEDGNGQDRLQ